MENDSSIPCLIEPESDFMNVSAYRKCLDPFIEVLLLRLSPMATELCFNQQCLDQKFQILFTQYSYLNGLCFFGSLPQAMGILEGKDQGTIQ